MGGYIPASPEIRREMLSKIGAESIDSLFADIPAEIKAKPPIEHSRRACGGVRPAENGTLAQKNRVYKTVFRGAGAYRHYIPSIVKNVVSKRSS